MLFQKSSQLDHISNLPLFEQLMKYKHEYSPNFMQNIRSIDSSIVFV